MCVLALQQQRFFYLFIYLSLFLIFEATYAKKRKIGKEEKIYAEILRRK